jgi:hypothetical protein
LKKKEKDPLEYNIDTIELGFLGSGVPLFYSFLKFGATFLSIIILVSGIQGLSLNSSGEGCDIYNLAAEISNNPEDRCRYVFQNTYSTSNAVKISDA